MTKGVVIKVGGSLLRGKQEEVNQTLVTLKDWLDDLHYSAQLLIAGGGTAVDELRQRFAQGRIDEEAAHWEAIRLMDANTQVMADNLHVPVVDAFHWHRGSSTGQVRLLVSAFLRTDDSQPGHLPHSWDVSSDSIAAQIALRSTADLIILKSCPVPAVPGEYDWPSLARAGVVDAHFPHIAPKIRSITLVSIQARHVNKIKKNGQ